MHHIHPTLSQRPNACENHLPTPLDHTLAADAASRGSSELTIELSNPRNLGIKCHHAPPPHQINNHPAFQTTPPLSQTRAIGSRSGEYHHPRCTNAGGVLVTIIMTNTSQFTQFAAGWRCEGGREGPISHTSQSLSAFIPTSGSEGTLIRLETPSGEAVKTLEDHYPCNSQNFGRWQVLGTKGRGQFHGLPA